MIRTMNYRLVKGYSLLEVMLTLVVVGVGLLAIVQLQSGISGQVGDNKTKAEATTLAEARIETLRNYINETEYGAKLLATSGFEDVPAGEYNAEGVNATFSMEESIAGGDEIREISVRVSWQDRNGSSEEVTVTSEIAYVSPAAAGQKALLYIRESDLSLPTGSAKPGEGSLPDADQKVVVDNDDGTREAVDGPDKYLLVGDDIQLVLENVCNTDTGICEDDFTRLHGRVYIDRATYPDLTVGQVNVVASNAAYCTRIINTENEPILYDDDGNVIPEQRSFIVPLSNQSTTGMTTSLNADYEYFDYNCYVGSGWYGNIGVYIAEPDETRRRNIKVCMGDPVEEFALQEYVLSAYRSYRGMLYETDANGAIPSSIRSIGVAGGLELGFEQTIGTENVKLRPVDNFVISLLPTSASDPACIDKGILVRNDALPLDSGIFHLSPDDFVCLNNPQLADYGLNGYDPATAVLDAEACPYDPTNETFARDDVSGQVTIVDL
ncbi:MAG: prepilin-type N-terminal cleavage/methylation domain-containing protein [Chromatiales bacterium]